MSLRLLFGDETNTTASDGDFFIYGAVAVSPDALFEAHDLIGRIRVKYGFKSEDAFKFHTRSRPAHMDFDTWNAAKAELLEEASKINELDLLTYVVLHDIAKGVGAAGTAEFALNVILSHFDKRYLPDKGARGIVSYDRLDLLGFAYLKDRLTKPLKTPTGHEYYLNNTLLLSQTCDGASLMSSLVDISLGAFRYCVNTTTGQGKDEIARAMFPNIARMMWGPHQIKEGRSVRQVGGHGFLRYPKQVIVPSYKARYDELAAQLTSYGVEPGDSEEATESG